MAKSMSMQQRIRIMENLLYRATHRRGSDANSWWRAWHRLGLDPELYQWETYPNGPDEGQLDLDHNHIYHYHCSGSEIPSEWGYVKYGRCRKCKERVPLRQLRVAHVIGTSSSSVNTYHPPVLPAGWFLGRHAVAAMAQRVKKVKKSAKRRVA